jgi:hypothetical protein
MKKFFATLMILMMISLPIATNAQTYVKRYVGRDGRVRYVRVKKPSFYRRHRNASNIALGTGGGAILGAIIGGRKGALIGTGVGAGGSALYTYKIKPKKRRYYKVRNY